MKKKIYNLVRFDDKLVYHGSYYLSPRSIKTICYLVARYVNPEEDRELPTQLLVPVKELANALFDGTNTKMYKSIYQEIDGICKELTSSQIRFNSKVEVEGVKLRGYLNWCSSAIPVQDQDGNAAIQLSFDPMIAQFFLGLSRYVRLYRPELNRLQSGHSIRLFQMLKGIRNKKTFEKISIEKYEVEQLKFLLGVDGKYPQYKDFNKRIIKPSIKEINEKTTIKILEVKPIRQNRKIQSLEFHFADKSEKQTVDISSEKDYIPSLEETDKLTWSKYNAYQLLVDFGVREGIAFRQLLPMIKGEVFDGFEDYFVKSVLSHFRKTSKQKDAGTLVNWWYHKKSFELSSEMWSKILERVVAQKKELEQKDPEAFVNRLKAKTMTRPAFQRWYKKQGKLHEI